MTSERFPFASSSESVSEVGVDANADNHGAFAPEEYGERVAQLFRDEHARVVRYLVARTGSGSEARDIAAQAFAQVLEMDPRTVSFLKAYIYRAARNIAIDRSKSRAVRRRVDPVVKHEFASTSPSPEPALCEEQRYQTLQRAIASLSPRVRLALELRFWDGFTISEIVGRFAEKGISVNERTVRRWFVYAVDHCREEILRAENAQKEEMR